MILMISKHGWYFKFYKEESNSELVFNPFLKVLVSFFQIVWDIFIMKWLKKAMLFLVANWLSLKIFRNVDVYAQTCCFKFFARYLSFFRMYLIIPIIFYIFYNFFFKNWFLIRIYNLYCSVQAHILVSVEVLWGPG